MMAFGQQTPVARIPELKEDDETDGVVVVVEARRESEAERRDGKVVVGEADPVQATIIQISPLSSKAAASKRDSWESKSSGRDTGYFSNGSAKSLDKNVEQKVMSSDEEEI